MLKEITLKNGRKLGSSQPCFVVAEIGSNHNRSLSLARELIDAAAEAGADAVKLQVYSADTLYSTKTPTHSGYEKNLHTLIGEIETPREWLEELALYSAAKKLIFFATPFDCAAVDELNPYSLLFKIASFEIVDLALIEYIASKGKPVVISTGLSTIDEIWDAVNVCRSAGNEQIILLQCASLYPAPPEAINLRALNVLNTTFGLPVGLSDHTLDTHIAVAAVAMGACMIEKHFTLSRSMKGPDHPFAMEPADLKRLVRQIRDVELAFGDGLKQGPSSGEMENYSIARRSLHAACNIPKGTVLTPEMICSKRPGLGISPKHLKGVIGKKAITDIEADDWLTWEMLEGSREIH